MPGHDPTLLTMVVVNRESQAVSGLPGVLILRMDLGPCMARPRGKEAVLVAPP